MLMDFLKSAISKDHRKLCKNFNGKANHISILSSWDFECSCIKNEHVVIYRGEKMEVDLPVLCPAFCFLTKCSSKFLGIIGLKGVIQSFIQCRNPIEVFAPSP